MTTPIVLHIIKHTIKCSAVPEKRSSYYQEMNSWRTLQHNKNLNFKIKLITQNKIKQIAIDVSEQLKLSIKGGQHKFSTFYCH